MRWIVVLLFCTVSFAFITQKNSGNGNKLTTPPGTVLIKPGLYIDAYEISVGNWKDYTEGWLLAHENDTATYQSMLPDSLVWVSYRQHSEEFIETYYRGNSYNSYPIVGISYEQAQAFCNWRTERVNELLARMPNAPFRSVTYRLPTEAEWEMAASGKLDSIKFPYGYPGVYTAHKNDSVKNFNCRYPDDDSLHVGQRDIMPVNFSIPNQYGVYNMIGNVGEMIAEKGVAKGGHYDLPLAYCTIKERMSYKNPNRWLGFRCVCEVETAAPFKGKNSKPKKGKSVKGFEQASQEKE